MKFIHRPPASGSGSSGVNERIGSIRVAHPAGD
jgi:hypothetical protein